MIKRIFILFWLIAAYAVVFAHSVVPHHHDQKDHAETSHHHHDTGDHQHEEEHNSEAGDTHNNFHLFQHQGATGDFFVPSFKYSAPTFNKEVATIQHAIQKLIQLCDEGPPLQYFIKRSHHSLLQQEHFYFFSVKAPPALS